MCTHTRTRAHTHTHTRAHTHAQKLAGVGVRRQASVQVYPSDLGWVCVRKHVHLHIVCARVRMHLWLCEHDCMWAKGGCSG